MPKSTPAKTAAKPAKAASADKPAKTTAKSAAKADAPAEKRKLSGEELLANSEIISSRGAATKAPKDNDESLTPFLRQQKQRLLQLRDNILDSMNGVAKDTLRSRAEGSEASAFGMHQADAGSDAYDRDFALSLLSQEQDALYEIEEGLKRIELGTYGVCEMSGKPIAHARLEAIPFARFTVECQTQVEKQNKAQRSRTPVTSLFGLTDAEEGGDGDEEEPVSESKE